MKNQVAIVGAGAWGTTLATLLSDKGYDCTMWAYEEEVAEEINATHKNTQYLPDINLPKAIKATTNLKTVISGKELVVSVVPSRNHREIWEKGANFITKNAVLVSCTKGIEEGSLKLMGQVLDEVLLNHPTDNRVVLSGPSFAKEVAKKTPTSVVIAGDNLGVCKKVQEIFRTETFLTFTNSDKIGVEVGGAVKNVIAIATGMSEGLGFGHNTQATIITRGLYEIIKIGRILGANPITFAGLSGIGDLVLTCTADTSRNYSVGKALGKGQKIKDILSTTKTVAEGVTTAKAVYELSRRHGLNTPICDAMYRILYEDLSPKDAVTQLCKLTLKEEMGTILNT